MDSHFGQGPVNIKPLATEHLKHNGLMDNILFEVAVADCNDRSVDSIVLCLLISKPLNDAIVLSVLPLLINGWHLSPRQQNNSIKATTDSDGQVSAKASAPQSIAQNRLSDRLLLSKISWHPATTSTPSSHTKIKIKAAYQIEPAATMLHSCNHPSSSDASAPPVKCIWPPPIDRNWTCKLKGNCAD